MVHCWRYFPQDEVETEDGKVNCSKELDGCDTLQESFNLEVSIYFRNKSEQDTEILG